MANPPSNRRPGVDADILQANWVRGYDGPQLADDPCDLLVSNGQNAVDLRVSDILFWNRTDDREQPMFVLLPGLDKTTAPRFQVHAGDLPDPNGLVSSTVGSLYLSNTPAGLWQNTTGADAWTNLTTGGAPEDLETTLAEGNFTGNNSIVLSKFAGVGIKGADTSDTSGGGPIDLTAGSETGATGDGGAVLLRSGNTVGGNSGLVSVSTPGITGAGNTGSVSLITGTNLGVGNAGGFSVLLGAGSLGGEFLVTSGSGNNAGSRGGRLQLFAGSAPADGGGGQVNIVSGSTGLPVTFFNPFIPGRAGSINVVAGNSAGAEPGGSVLIAGGIGGAAAGVGGSITLRAGAGSGGAADGIVLADGVFQADNYLRGDGDPNVLGIAAPEGSIFQRSTAGVGEAWVNVDGDPAGWAKLLTSGGGIVSALTQIQWGSLTAGSDATTDEMDSLGVLHGAVGTDINYQETAVGALLTGFDGTPARNFGTPAAVGSASGVYVDTLLTRNANFRAVWKFAFPSINANQRMFFGCSSVLGGNDVTTQLAVDNPAGNWFGVWKKAGETAFRFQAQNVGNNSLLSGVTLIASQVYYVVLDCKLDANGGVVASILDDQYNLLGQHHFQPDNSILGESTKLRFLAGTGSDGGAATSSQLHQIAIVTRTDLAEAAFGGSGGFNPPLAQVLVAGNSTGGKSLILSNGDLIQGEEDGAGGHGSPVGFFSGATTNAANNTGNVAIASATGGLAGFSGATGQWSGGSGLILDATNTATGDTGDVILVSGSSQGVSGAVGDVQIFSGTFFGGGGGALATGGNILLHANGAVGGTTNSIPGNVSILAGTTTIAGATGGALTFTSGGSSTNGDSGTIELVTPDALSTDGSTGDINLLVGKAGSNSGSGGRILLSSGNSNSPAALGGHLLLRSGSAFLGSGGDSGDVILEAGNSEFAQGGHVLVTTGSSTVGGQRGGDFVFTPGVGPGGAGEFIINGKLTVTGPIDPTGLLFTGVAGAPPLVPVGGEGILWTDTDDNDNLKYSYAGGTATLSNSTNLDAPNFKAGTTAPLPAGALVGFAIPFGPGTGFTAAPRVVQISLEGSPTGTVITIDSGSIAAGAGTDFTVSASAALVGGEVIHWTAWL